MDKIARIRQEIERLKVDYLNRSYTFVPTAMNQLLEFLDTLSEEPDNDDLNEEIKKLIEKYGYERGGDRLLIAIVARHFAEWQKEQMLKGAFVSNYVVHDGRIELEGDPLPSLDPILLLPYPQFKPGDKVRIIIVKED